MRERIPKSCQRFANRSKRYSIIQRQRQDLLFVHYGAERRRLAFNQRRLAGDLDCLRDLAYLEHHVQVRILVHLKNDPAGLVPLEALELDGDSRKWRAPVPAD